MIHYYKVISVNLKDEKTIVKIQSFPRAMAVVNRIIMRNTTNLKLVRVEEWTIKKYPSIKIKFEKEFN